MSDEIRIPIIIDENAAVNALKKLGSAAVGADGKLTGMSGKLGGLGKGLAALNPLFGIAAAVASSYALKLFESSNATKELTEEQKRLAQIQKSVAQELGKEVAKVSALKAAIDSEVTSRLQKERALKQLQKINPEYFSGLRIEEGLINKLNTAYGNYIKSITTRAELNILQKQLEDLSVTIVDLERQGAKNLVYVPKVTDEYGRQLSYVRGITKEQAEQNRLNIPYSNALREREILLGQILQKQQGVTDPITELTVPVKTLKVKASKLEIGPFGINAFDFDQEALKRIKIPKPGFNQNPDKSPVTNISIGKDTTIEDLIKANQELLAYQQKVADSITGLVSPAFSSWIDAVLEKQNALQAFFTSIGNAIINLTKQFIEAIAKAAILSLISGGAAGGGVSFAQAFKKIKPFAAGGMVSGPTMSLIGEGSGTSFSNPEVVAPLDKLQNFFSGLMAQNRNYGTGGMGSFNAGFSIPDKVQLYGSGRSLNGVMVLEKQSQQRTG